MKNGSIFDAYNMERFEQWKQDRSEALAETVISAFCGTANNPDPAADFVHGFLRELLLASGYTEEGLEIWEFMSEGESDHES